MKIPLLYIAGPYRSITRAGVDANIATARRVGALAAAKGWAPLVPHTNTAHMDELVDLGDQFWLDATMEMMRRCDAVLLCPGWTLSSGTKDEVAEATRLGLPIFFEDVMLPLASMFRCPLGDPEGEA